MRCGVGKWSGGLGFRGVMTSVSMVGGGGGKYVYSRREGSYYSLSNKAQRYRGLLIGKKRKVKNEFWKRRTSRRTKHMCNPPYKTEPQVEISKDSRDAPDGALLFEQGGMSARVKGVMGYWFPPEVDRGYTKTVAPCRPIASHGTT